MLATAAVKMTADIRTSTDSTASIFARVGNSRILYLGPKRPVLFKIAIIHYEATKSVGDDRTAQNMTFSLRLYSHGSNLSSDFELSLWSLGQKIH